MAFDFTTEDAIVAVMRATRKARGDGTPWLLVRVQDGKAFEMTDVDFCATQDGQNTRDAFFHRRGE